MPCPVPAEISSMLSALMKGSAVSSVRRDAIMSGAVISVLFIRGNIWLQSVLCSMSVISDDNAS